MANYSVLKAAVQAVVKTNGNQEITGANMQSTLISIINSLGTGYQFMGVATPSTSPGTPDYNVAYIGGAGTYANFGSLYTVPVGSIGVFKYNGSWTRESFAMFAGIDDVPTAGSDNLVKSGGVDGTTVKEPNFSNGFIPSSGNFVPNDGYRCSDFLPCDLISKLNISSLASIDINFYDKDKVHQRYAVLPKDADGFVNILPGYKYFRYWASASNISAVSLVWLKEELDIVIDEVYEAIDGKASVKSLNELTAKLYGRTEIDTTWSHVFIANNGTVVQNNDYCCSDYIPYNEVKAVVNNGNLSIYTINVFDAEKTSTPIANYSVNYGDYDNEFNLPTNAAAGYFRIWFPHADLDTAGEQIDFILNDGDLEKIENDIVSLQEKLKKQNPLVYLNNCVSASDFNAAYKGQDATYTDKTSEISVVEGGISIPYGTGTYTWNKNLYRVNPKTWIFDFTPNGCSLLNVFTYGFNNGDNGIATMTPYISVDIINNSIRIPRNGESTQFTFSSSGTYRVVIFQEDKHIAVKVVNLVSGAESSELIYNGVTDGNVGLMYDTLAFYAETASPILKNYMVVSKAKQPFLSVYGDSITTGFTSTIENGVNHTKYSYLVGLATGREFTTSGRGGASFNMLFGGKCYDSKFEFSGMLVNELPKLCPNYAMFTIGTNGGGSYNQYKEIVEYVLSLGITPILNTLPIRADGGTDANVSYIASANQAIMQLWKDYNIHGARFDLATSLNNDGVTINSDLFKSDKIHPNDAGHAAMAARVMIDCPELFSV